MAGGALADDQTVAYVVALGLLLTAASARAEPCAATVPVFRHGELHGHVCAEEARAKGLALVDLSDDWTPRVLSASQDRPEDAPGYRAVYLALADERPERMPKDQPFERNLELYGIFPTLRVVRARVLDDERHACHAAIDDGALATTERVLSPFTPDIATQRQRVERVRKLRGQLEHARKRHGLADVDALEHVRGYAYAVRQLRRDDAILRAVEAVQEHMRCEKLLAWKPQRGVFEGATSEAIRTFQRRHMLIAGPFVEASTRAALLAGSRELDFRTALRVLRERVVDAQGLIEDGSASAQAGSVLGRYLDPPELRAVLAQGALKDAAPDHVSLATEAAARALGLDSPDRLAAFFRSRDESATRRLVVALPLPAPPAYHAAEMELRAEIDRGDVYYDYPFTATGRPKHQPVERRATLVLYAKDGESFRPLVRWNTTIGGFQPEQVSPELIGLRYKESPVGPRVWRDLVAAPAWLPPPSTPDSELLRFDRETNTDVFKYELFGPSHRSAYGLTMLVHLAARGKSPTEEAQVLAGDLRDEARQAAFDSERFHDQGVRTHGSVSYNSILRGYSHGCHRLWNHLAVRLSGFLLSHRKHVRRGDMRVLYDRSVSHGGKHHLLRLRTRGYRYELTPPIPLQVLPGRIRGSRKRPIPGLRPLREDLLPKLTQTAEGTPPPEAAAREAATATPPP